MLNGHVMQLREARTLAQEEREVLPSDVADIVDEEPENIESSGLPCDPVVEDSPSSIQHRDEDHNKLENSHLSPRNKVNGKSNADGGSAHHGGHGDSKCAAFLSNSVSYFSFSLQNLGFYEPRVCYRFCELVDVFRVFLNVKIQYHDGS